MDISTNKTIVYFQDNSLFSILEYILEIMIEFEQFSDSNLQNKSLPSVYRRVYHYGTFFLFKVINNISHYNIVGQY